MLFDTDVIIWALRGNLKAARFIDAEKDRFVSAVTYMELIRGARNNNEVRAIKLFLSDLGFRTLPLNENTGHRAMIYIEEYGLKAGLEMADALIAATAAENAFVLATSNAKHYKPIPDIGMKVFKR